MYVAPGPRSRRARRSRARGRLAALIALIAAIAIVLVVVLGSGGSASTSTHAVESIFQDDDYLIYNATPVVTKTLDTLASLGVQRVRLTVAWDAIAPGAGDPTPPAGFDGANPGAYPAAAWAPYDRVAKLAAARHIGVDFDVTGPGPLWAMKGHSPVARYQNHYEPSAPAFGEFVQAVGKRYSGSFVPAGASQPLPRVSYWSIWNEPNQPGWMAPQWATSSGTRVIESAKLYRENLGAAYRALVATGHSPSSDTILIGELAPEGTEGTGAETPVPPLPFLRSLYCVDSSYKPLSGATAAALGCPSGGGASAFVKSNPALFDATGFGHHPYSFFLPPSASLKDPNFAPLSDLGRLEHALDSVFSAYGVTHQLPLYLTEYGYETNPPNPFRGVSPATQAAYIDEGQYMAWLDPRVRAMTQFLLYDSPPDTKYPKGSVGYWSTFQTGLLYANGVAKPALAAYRLPLWIPQSKFTSGSSVYIWGMLRLAPAGSAQSASIQWAAPHGSFRTVATVRDNAASGVLTAHVKLLGTGRVRIEWTSAAGKVFHSRVAKVQQT
jgi:hypothetical protein